MSGGGVPVGPDRTPSITTRFATRATDLLGSPAAIVAAVLVVLVWAPSYWLIHDLDTWQLVINTGTTIVTFLMTFVILNTENRESRALHAKVDAIIAANAALSNQLLGLEEADDRHIKAVQREIRGQ